jgi:hypothetical protein
MDFTRSEWIDEVTNEYRRQKESEINELERTHFTLLFLFELLQFSLQFMTRVPELDPTDGRRNPNSPICLAELVPL